MVLILDPECWFQHDLPQFVRSLYRWLRFLTSIWKPCENNIYITSILYKINQVKLH